MDANVLTEALKKHFGFETFRKGQKEIVERLLDGQDVLGILPTGTGKSLCYQLPSLFLKGKVIIVSPLISLMLDQVKQLKGKGFKKVVAVNSFLEQSEKMAIYESIDKYDMIFCSPEMLQNDLFLKRLQTLTISLFVVDEAHCISQWGHEFRTDYLKMKDVLTKLNDPQVLALSATATPKVQEDIIEQLGRPKMDKQIFPMDRDNITFTVEKVSNWFEKTERVVEVLKQFPVPAMIYFSSKMWCERVSEQLKQRLPKLRVAYYHGGMETEDRLLIQNQFMNNQLDVICCTSAFGMGIDKPNVRMVIHFHMPSQVESFIQEVGRAGRDGGGSVSLLLYSQGDEEIPQFLMEQELPTKQQIKVSLQILQNKQVDKPLQRTIDYIQTETNVNETQWNFIKFQLEKHQVLQQTEVDWCEVESHLVTLQQKRMVEKQKGLMTLLNWMNTDNCRRKMLYQSFQKGIKTPKEYCCDNCDFTFSKWKPELIQVEKSQGEVSWEEELKKLFHQGERNEKKKKSS
ncbi:RecQ family ATP-dependent DNA helicase [Salirhabdus salicampi]|uniref:RecQ family ATP-dependent DNA helicase n=1 Tax=Salirhabdus salicampi TaxID=476102 RepID=UPI0020C4C4F7|nr:ATP-dependent DNA helicase RecQ [Salirhabdus salicampi]MCP8616730.1 ATP-dependent DNA helicase [Salirhabdus salicampi]